MSMMSIGALSQATGVKVPTIRYYEDVGLLPRPNRTESNRRFYGQDDIERLRFVRHARDLGFPVDAIRDLLLLQYDPTGPCDQVDAMARRQLVDVEERIRQLESLRSALGEMIAQCTGDTIRDCRIIEALSSA